MKKGKVILGISVVFVAAIGYLLWPEKRVEASENMKALDIAKKENKEFYLLEESLGNDMKNIVEPFLEEKRITGYFKGYDGNELYYEQYPVENSKGHIVVVHGFTDATYKFHEVIYYFVKSGYSVSALDHRGHGYSYRANDNLSKITIDEFEEYTKDFKIFVADIVKPCLKQNEKLFAYAHSMGGAITTSAIEEDSSMFDAVVLTSPMMEIEFNGIPNNAAMLIVKLAYLLGIEDDYTVGTGDYEEIYDYSASSYTSEARYNYVMQYGASDKHYRMSGGNYKWLACSLQGVEKLLKNASKYHTKTLLFQAELDTTVGPNGQNAFVSKASNVQPILVKGAKHSILFSDNETFIPYMNTILEFYQENL